MIIKICISLFARNEGNYFQVLEQFEQFKMYRNMPTFKNYTLTNVKVMKNSLTNQIILIATNCQLYF